MKKTATAQDPKPATTATGKPATTTHYAAEIGGKTLCGSATATTTNSHDNPHKVTCKRCLATLERETKAADPKDLAGKAADPKAADPKDLAGKAAAKVAELATGKKASKAKTPSVHLHQDQTGHTLKSGEAAPHTWCRIPGPTSQDPAAVTCKVCRAHLDGVKPNNALPDGVRAARKHFASFVARASYMGYMDHPAHSEATPCTWSLTYRNSAGVTYTITGNAGTYGLAEVHPGMGVTDAGTTTDHTAIKALIAAAGWEA